jgi:hypothetical protein
MSGRDWGAVSAALDEVGRTDGGTILDDDAGLVDELERRRQQAENNAVAASAAPDSPKPPSYYGGKADGLQAAINTLRDD